MSTHPLILPLGYSEAAQFLRRPDHTVRALVSIHGYHESPLTAPAIPLRLDLTFDDTDAPDPADPIATLQAFVRRRTEAENGRTLLPPTQDHVQQLIAFAHATQTLDGTLLLHCSGGISRSPAAALICLATWTGPGHEPYCLHYLKQIRPAAHPHPDLIRIADQLLNRNGCLLAAVQ